VLVLGCFGHQQRQKNLHRRWHKLCVAEGRTVVWCSGGMQWGPAWPPVACRDGLLRWPRGRPPLAFKHDPERRHALELAVSRAGFHPLGHLGLQLVILDAVNGVDEDLLVRGGRRAPLLNLGRRDGGPREENQKEEKNC